MDTVPTYSWIFFSSPNSVQYFLNKTIIPSGVNIAVVGEGTKKVVEAAGFTVDFCSKENDTDKIGKEFSLVSQGQKVLFPQSDISKRSIPRQLDPSCVIDLVVYKTRSKTGIKKRDEDYLVFTSPSNAENYFSKFKRDPHQITVAIGKTTAKALENYSDKIIISRSPSEIDLWHAIMFASCTS